MMHQMRLQKKPFDQISSGAKTIELRLNDEKRRKVQAGDFIEFSLLNQPETKIQVRVTALHRFASFQELYAAFPKEELGYLPEETPDSADMDAFYSKEDQEKYGVLGIELRMTALQKFLDAQEYGYDFGDTYETALAEIRRGKKHEHWMWYVFPQIQGLGWSGTTGYFSIRDLEEAVDYYEHPILGARLIEITSELLNLRKDDLVVILGRTDAYKLRSCMTLFKYAVPGQELFRKVLDHYCMGSEDVETVDVLGLS